MHRRMRFSTYTFSTTTALILIAASCTESGQSTTDPSGPKQTIVACESDDVCGPDSECMTHRCVEGACVHAPIEAGTSCTAVANGICDGMGQCVACNGDADCLDGTCVEHVCVPADECSGANDCASGVCIDGACHDAACIDGVLNGDETGVDCGGACPACGVGLACDDASDCTSAFCAGGTCAYATSCADLLAEGSSSGGRVTIDPDGSGPREPYEVYCEQGLLGGGWTLATVTSDDGVHTWTYNNRELFTTNEMVIGDLDHRDRDFKSLALHDIAFTDILFVHAPSGTTALYEDVGDGTASLAAFMAAVPFPNCDLSSGYALTGGTLALGGTLCDTNLYFNAGDYDGEGLDRCQNMNLACNHAAFGPGWSDGSGDGCPHDDPGFTGMGPTYGVGPALAQSCPAYLGFEGSASVGFGGTLGLNTGMAGTGANHMAMYVR